MLAEVLSSAVLGVDAQTDWPALRSDFVQPSDHCDNWVNKEVCLVCGGKSNAIFSRIERAHYRVR